MRALSDLITAARIKGWVVASGDIEEVECAAVDAGWAAVRNRSYGDLLTELRPFPREQAPPRSLSALTGLGEQPLHIDGAHLPRPPDWIVLHAASSTKTATRLWRPLAPQLNLRSGIFLVGEGSGKLLTHAYDDEDGWRYDPGCMQPADQRARALVEWVNTVGSKGEVTHEWDRSDTFLLIDNRRVLHGRAAVDGDVDTRILSRLSYALGGQA